MTLSRLKSLSFKTLCKNVVITFSVQEFYPGLGFNLKDFFPDLTLLCVCWVTPILALQPDIVDL